MKKSCRICLVEQDEKDFPIKWIKDKKGIYQNRGKRAECRKCSNARRCSAYHKDPRGSIFNNIRTRCKRDNILCTITKEDIVIPSICPIMQVPLSKGTKGNYDYSPTVDRLIPSLGYVKGNIKVISMIANRLKSNATLEQLELFYKNIFKYMNDDIV